MDCKINKPYPKVQVLRKNTYYANLLLEDYSGAISELSSITQYEYQKFNKFDVDLEFASILSSIAMVEMKHLELLGETIKLLGIDPKFVYSNYNLSSYWNGSFVDYTTNIINMLQSDIKIEKEAIAKYSYDISVIDDEYIKATLYRIIEDEKQHIKCFEYLLNKYSLNC